MKGNVQLTVIMSVLLAWAIDIALCSKYTFALSMSGIWNLL